MTRLCLGVGLIVLLGVFFRFYHLDHKVFWEDEILGAVHTLGYTEEGIVAASPGFADASDVQRYMRPDRSLGVVQTIDSLAIEDPQHAPAYYVVDHLWVQRFGGSIEAMRMPAAIFGVLVLPCVFWLALELFGSLAPALIAVALVAVSPFFVLYAQEAREYSMWTAVIALQCAVFLRAVRLRSTVLWIAYAALTAVALYVYPLSGLVVLGLGAYLLILERGKFGRPLIACIVADVCALALFTPWLKAMTASAGLSRGMAKIFASKLTPLEVARIFARDVRQLFFDVGPVHLGPIGSSALDAAFTVMLIAVCAYAFVTLVRRTPFALWGFIVVGLCLSMIPLLVRDLLGQGNFVYQARYFLPLLLGVLLAISAFFGIVLTGTPQRATRAAWAALLFVIITGEALSCAASSQATTWWNKDDERAPEVAAVINAAQKPLVISDYFTPTILELSLYLDPAVPVRLNLKCAQCTLATNGVTFDTGGYRSVFAVQASDPANGAGYRWVDPAPFPAQPGPLNMFSVVSPVN